MFIISRTHDILQVAATAFTTTSTTNSTTSPTTPSTTSMSSQGTGSAFAYFPTGTNSYGLSWPNPTPISTSSPNVFKKQLYLFIPLAVFIIIVVAILGTACYQSPIGRRMRVSRLVQERESARLTTGRETGLIGLEPPQTDSKTQEYIDRVWA
jgi:hypothetical protein